MALTTVSCCPLEEPCKGRSLTIVAVGEPPPPPPPCSPPPLPPHPATTKVTATPSTASIPIRRCPIALPPFLNRTTRTLTPPAPSDGRRFRMATVESPLTLDYCRVRFSMSTEQTRVRHMI